MSDVSKDSDVSALPHNSGACAECFQFIGQSDGLRAHIDCDQPETGVVGSSEGYSPSGLGLTL